MATCLEFRRVLFRSALERHLDKLQKIGFELDLAGPESVVIRAVPALLARAASQELVRDILAELVEMRHSRRPDNLLDALLSIIACGRSVCTHWPSNNCG